MKIYAFFMLLGCFTTLLIPETRRKTLEEMSGEEGTVSVIEQDAQQDALDEERKL
jgi:MFS transporter, PHS family, inorganic phosphate transporter